MAWYDNLQYPDYARHYENQGKIYSDLLNSLSKIGGEYLQQQREDVARKNMPTPEQYTTNYPEIKGINPQMARPAIPQLYGAGNPYADTPEGLMPYMTQRGQGALNAIEGTKGSPARTEFDQTGYINALAKLMTGGNLEERNAAKDAYTVFGMQEQSRKAALPQYTSRPTNQDTYKTNPVTGEEILVQKGKEKGQWVYDKDSNAVYTETDKIPSGYISEKMQSLKVTESGKNTRQDKGIKANIQTALTSDNFKENQNYLDRQNTIIVTNLKEAGIAGRADITNQLSKRSQLVREVNGKIGYPSQLENIRSLQTKINDIDNFLIDESKKRQTTTSKSGEGKTNGNSLNIIMEPYKK